MKTESVPKSNDRVPSLDQADKIKQINGDDMKTAVLISIFSVSLSIMFTAQNVFAGDDNDGAGLAECKAIVAECKTAGFTHEGQGGQKRIWVDCVGSVSQGKKIPGVAQSKEQARSCRQAQRKARLAAKPKS